MERKFPAEICKVEAPLIPPGQPLFGGKDAGGNSAIATFRKSSLYRSDSGPARYPTESGVTGRMERQALK
jgi:hypothetical protein